MTSRAKRTVGYAAVIGGCYALGMLVAWPGVSPVAIRIDNYAYDVMLTRQSVEAWAPQSVVVAIDAPTLSDGGGMPGLRAILADMLPKIDAAQPKVVALDVTLHDRTRDDDRLEAALRATKNLVLPCDMIADGKTLKWEDPLPRFPQSESTLGHVYWKAGSDGVNREVPLEVIVDGRQRWALALQAFSVAQGQPIVQSPDEVLIGDMSIPASREEGDRPMLIRYLAQGIPTVSAQDIDLQRERIRGKAVFVGVTAPAAGDRASTPYGAGVPGVYIWAQAYETLARGKFLTPARPFTVPALCALLAIAAGLTFGLRSGWQAYVLGGAVLFLAHWIPVWLFRHDVVFPYFAPVSVAWLSTVGAASFRYLFVQRELKTSESEKSRYQQAIHWAAHEMRTPLTTIQGSSEIMTRYALSDDKRLQLSTMINSESKRLARMIQTFLDVERLADGHMELKREPFLAADFVDTCLRRAIPIGEQKKITVSVDGPVEGTITGDRELMEYALYNLLTNAIKYSPAGTEVHVSGVQRGGELRLSIRDQGIGMDAKEQKNVFKKFYRTKSAEASGEVGTGIGLSIVEQIVKHHGGRVEVESEPQKGSCFTIIIAAVFPASTSAASQNAETFDRRG